MAQGPGVATGQGHWPEVHHGPVDAPELQSPRLRELADEVASGHPEAVEAFWTEVAKDGTPLIEPAEEQGSVLVTLLARGTDAQARLWVSPFGLGSLALFDREMRLLDGTDLLYWTHAVPSNVRTVYAFSGTAAPDDQDLLADPLARQPYVYPADEELTDDHELRVALVELPDAPPPRWSAPDADAPPGRVEMERFESQRLGGMRRVYSYAPADYDPAAGPYPLLILLDGWAFTQFVPAPVVLDNLIHRGAIPPVVAVMPDSGENADRMRELWLSDDFNAFIADELLPWARARWNLATAPKQVIAAGSSLGGTAAVYLGLQRPDLVGSVISLSGAFQVMPEGDAEPVWLARELARRDRLPVRFWLGIGSLETVAAPEHPSLLSMNRHLRDVLVAKGYRVDYSEFPGGHDYFWWVETLADGLIALLG